MLRVVREAIVLRMGLRGISYSSLATLAVGEEVSVSEGWAG